MAEPKRSTGTVKWFSAQKGFGFIAPDDGGDDLFVHQTSILTDGFRTLFEGQLVEFSIDIADDMRSKAADVVVLDDRSRHPSAARGRGGGRGWYGGGRFRGGGGYGRGGGGGGWRGSGYGGGGGYRGGRSSGEGGGGGGGPCYNCGRTGHLARDCYQGGGRGGRRYGGGGGYRGGGGSGGRGCFNCGEEGHLARDCPNEQQ